MNVPFMRTISFVLIMTFVSILGYANDNQLSNIEINSVYGRKLVVDMHDMHSTAQIILISGEGSAELLRVEAEGPAFAKQFDLSGLASGQYSLVIEYGIRELAQDIVLDEEKAFLKLKSRDIFIKPIVRQSNKDYVDLTMINKRIGSVQVEIVNSNGRIVYQEEIKNVLKVEKRYDLRKLSPDTYALVVKTPRKTYTDFIQNW